MKSWHSEDEIARDVDSPHLVKAPGAIDCCKTNVRLGTFGGSKVLKGRGFSRAGKGRKTKGFSP
jgi:hypothetical protein